MSQEPDAGKAIRIGLLWHSANSGNLGVGALTMGNMALARAAAADVGLTPKFVVIGMRDRESFYLNKAEAEIFDVDTRSLLSPRGCWSEIGRQDCVLDIGAGDSFADIYGLKRFLFLWLTKMFAIARGKPLVLSPQTIGPFTRKLYKYLAAIALSRATTIVARDPISFQVAKELAPSVKSLRSVDVAFALPYEDRSALRAGKRIRVGVNVSGLLFNNSEASKKQFGLQVDYRELMRGFIAALAARSDVEVHLIAHVNGPEQISDNDCNVANTLAEEFPSTVRVPNFAGPSEAKSYISSLDFLVAGRMHACIAAFAVGTPVVPVAYSRKFSGLFGMLNYPWMVPVTGVDTGEALSYLHDCFERREELACDIAKGMGDVRGLLELYRSELRTLFAASAKKS